MRICTDHWAKLRKAIDDRGLSHLVAKTGEEAHAAIIEQLQGAENKAAFDPLMNANFAIWSAFLEDAGLAGLAFEGCPLCEVAKSDHPHLDDEWIRGSTNDQLEHARSLGLIAAVQ